MNSCDKYECVSATDCQGEGGRGGNAMRQVVVAYFDYCLLGGNDDDKRE